MRSRLVLLLLLFPVLASAQSAPLDDAAVAAAITEGQTKKNINHLAAICAADPGFGANMAFAMAGGLQPGGAYQVVVSRAAGRIAFAAKEAKRLYQPFAVENVTDDMRQPGVHVSVVPMSPFRNQNAILYCPDVQRVVLKSKVDPNAVAQPAAETSVPVEWSNLMGGKLTSTAMYLHFTEEELSKFPKGDIDIVVVTPAGERRCKIGAGDRAKLKL